MSRNVVQEKSFSLAVLVVGCCRYLQDSQREYILSKQLMRSGTAIGAMIREARHAESKADFVHKLSIAQKEANETLYWLELLKESKLLDEARYSHLHSFTREVLKLLTAIILTTKKNLKKN